MSKDTFRGSCACGAVVYRIESPFLGFQNCYCSRCRKRTGTAHASSLFVAADRLRWEQGEEHVKRYELPSAMLRSLTPRLAPAPFGAANQRSVAMADSELAVRWQELDGRGHLRRRRDLARRGRAARGARGQHAEHRGRQGMR